MSYKLTYFDIRGRAEPIRLIFALAGQQYEDNRLQDEEWPALKPGTPWGQLPLLEIDGRTITQTTTIARFLARRFGLTGATEFEATRCEELVDATMDVQAQWVRIRFEETDEAKKEELKQTLIERTLPEYLAKLEKVQAKNGGDFLVGSSATWADAWIANALERFEEGLDSRALDKCPNLRRMKAAFFSITSVKAYVDKRP